MSIIVTGVEMPMACTDCPLYRVSSHDFSYCKGKGIGFGAEDAEWIDATRPNWCPIRSVPKAHGRLVDADALAAEYTLLTGEIVGFRIEPLGTGGEHAEIKIKLWKDVPTIVEAEE